MIFFVLGDYVTERQREKQRDRDREKRRDREKEIHLPLHIYPYLLEVERVLYLNFCAKAIANFIIVH